MVNEKTDLDCVKNLTKMIARKYIPEQAVIDGTVLPMCNHMFIDTPIWVEKAMGVLDLTINLEKTIELNLCNPKVYQKWCEEVFDKRVDSRKDIYSVYSLYRAPYKMTFIKLYEDFLDEKDYAELLGDAWVTEENPNMDVNVSIQESIRFFKKANKRFLMDKEEYLYYENLPNKIEVFRGVSKGRIKDGLSWTDNKEKAIWFMKRFDGRKSDDESMLLRAVINKKEALAYLNSRNEQEVVVDVLAIKDKIERVI